MDPATWYMIASAVLTVAGTVVQSNAQKAAASRTRAAIRKQDENQDPFRKKASELIRTTSDKMDPNLRMQTREKRDVENLKQYFQVYDKNRDIREASVFGGGNVFETERYSEGADEERKARDVRNMNAAAQFFSPYQASNIDETRMVNNMANSLNTNRNFAGGQFNVDQQAIERAKEVSSSAMMMGSILKGLGMVTGMAGAYSAGTAAAGTAATEAAKKAAVQQAAQQSMGTTASRFGLQTAASTVPQTIASTAPSWASAAGAGATAGASAGSNAFSFGLSAAELEKLRLANLAGVGSTARPMFAPLNAANSGVQSRSYQMWNTPIYNN